MFRKIGWLLIIFSVLAVLGEVLRLQLPTLRWAFNACREFDFGSTYEHEGRSELFPWPAYLFSALTLGLGILALWRFPPGFTFTPLTLRRLQRFKEIRRGYISFLIILILALIASLDHLLVGKEPLVMHYHGNWYFPALKLDKYKGRDFGVRGDLADAPVDYRKLQERFESQDAGNWLVMPPIPYAPTGDTIAQQLEQVEKRDDGRFYRPGSDTPYSGVLARVYDPKRPERKHSRFQVREGLPQGDLSGWNADGEKVYTANIRDGRTLNENYTGDESRAAFLKQGEALPLAISHSNPAPPLPENGHLLGTTPQGYDVVAYLYGGLQVNFKAAVFYIPCVYLIGISIGLVMGYFGGTFDLVVQRLIEVFSNIPFLFVVIIVSESVPPEYKSLGPIIGVLILFGWMGMTYLMRTAALKEKARDYVAASRVIGCPTPRVIFKHILPNAVAILVTLVPFSISGLIMALTSLDYLGFGLPDKYPTWGRLLKDGLNNLSSPWLASSAFCSLVLLLILVTFVGEAVREAFDPKKFTTYK